MKNIIIENNIYSRLGLRAGTKSFLVQTLYRGHVEGHLSRLVTGPRLKVSLLVPPYWSRLGNRD
jgi:hypothetical protein